MNEVNRQIISSLIGAISIGILLITTDFSYGLNVILAAGVGLGTYLTISPKSHIPKDELEEYIDEFYTLSSQCHISELKNEIEIIPQALEHISKLIKEYPEYPVNVDLFIKEYLKQARKTLKEILLISRAIKNNGEKIKLYESVKEIQTVCEKFREMLVNKVFDEIDTTEEMMKWIEEMLVDTPSVA